MKKLIVNEINHIRKMMGLNEQTAVDAVKSGVESSLKGSDDEYKLMGHIITFMGMEGPNGSTDDRMDWIEKYRSPIGKFGKSLFDYLHGNNSSYDTDFFNKLMKNMDLSKMMGGLSGMVGGKGKMNMSGFKNMMDNNLKKMQMRILYYLKYYLTIVSVFMKVVFHVLESGFLNNVHIVLFSLDLWGILWSLSIIEHKDSSLGVLVDTQRDCLVLEVVHLVQMSQ